MQKIFVTEKLKLKMKENKNNKKILFIVNILSFFIRGQIFYKVELYYLQKNYKVNENLMFRN